MAKGLTLSYEQCVQAIADAIKSEDSLPRSIVLVSSAYALSLAREKAVVEVEADIRKALAAR